VSAAASAAGHALMAEPASTARDVAEKLVLAGVGAVALTAERVDALVEELSARGGMGREEARSLVEELVGRWPASSGSSASLRAASSRSWSCAWPSSSTACAWSSRLPSERDVLT
jgi:hypothetical protein